MKGRWENGLVSVQNRLCVLTQLYDNHKKGMVHFGKVKKKKKKVITSGTDSLDITSTESKSCNQK